MIKGSVTVKPQQFAAAVKWAAKFISPKPTIPIQGGILLEVDAGTLTVSSMSEHISTRATVAAEGDATGRAVVSGRLLAELVATFGTKPVQIEGGDDDVALAVGRWRGTLPTMNEQDYPAAPASPPVIGTVAGADFATLIARVEVAARTDTSAMVGLCCVHMTFAGGQVTALATDKYRAATAAVPFRYADGFTPDDGGSTALILGAVLHDAGAAVAGPDEITVGLDANSLSLTSPSRSLTIRGMSEPYDAEAVRGFFAVDHPQEAGITVADMLQPLKRAGIMQAKSGPSRLSFSEGAITIVAKAGDVPQASDETVDAQYSGPEHDLVFNPEYLADALSSAPADVVAMHFTTEKLAQVVFTAAGHNWQHVVVPLKK